MTDENVGIVKRSILDNDNSVKGSTEWKSLRAVHRIVESNLIGKKNSCVKRQEKVLERKFWLYFGEIYCAVGILFCIEHCLMNFD